MIYSLAKMLLKHLFRSKGLEYPKEIKFSVKNGIINAEYEYHQIFINPEKQTVVMSERLRSVLFDDNNTDEQLPVVHNSVANLPQLPEPVIIPQDEPELYERKSPAESALKGVLDKLEVHRTAAAHFGCKDMYLNIDGRLCYPGNFESNCAGVIFPEGLTENDRDELIDLIYDNVKGVEDVPDVNAVVIHLDE